MSVGFQDSVGLRWHPKACPIKVLASLAFHDLCDPERQVRIADIEHLHTPGVLLRHSGREWLLTPEEARTLAHLLYEAADHPASA